MNTAGPVDMMSDRAARDRQAVTNIADMALAKPDPGPWLRDVLDALGLTDTARAMRVHRMHKPVMAAPAPAPGVGRRAALHGTSRGVALGCCCPRCQRAARKAARRWV